MPEPLLSIVPGHYPGFIQIAGLPFKVSIVLSATDLSTDEGVQRQLAAERLVACWNACAYIPTAILERMAAMDNVPDGMEHPGFDLNLILGSGH